jgi:hypothetical protein
LEQKFSDNPAAGLWKHFMVLVSGKKKYILGAGKPDVSCKKNM